LGVGWVELRETQRFCGWLDVGIRFAHPNLRGLDPAGTPGGEPVIVTNNI
jgi:hypothetical protein